MRFNKNLKDIFFKTSICIFLFVFILFIIFAIFGVLLRGIPNLIESLLDKEIQFAIKLSFFTSTISTIICLMFSIPISYGLVRFNFWGKKIINAIVQMPISIPPIASGIALLLLFTTKPIESIVTKLGIDPVFSVYGIIVAHFFINTPYMIKILKVTFESINPKLEFVARTLGYSSCESFFKVTLPLARNGVISGVIIVWTSALGEFGTALMLAGAIRMKTETLPAAIFLNLAGGELDKALAAATILIIMSIVCLSIFQLFEKRNTENIK
ncbi:ABC transporter permease [Clostridium sp. ZBS13]|uniref:ABC transporter permease n=1 Tax=Clostridium sp. ZBS13 TaxID=2949971 RepID=UPI002079745C|nr:ABC transporter permease [Clostridium sp. ZBS13]